MNGYATLFSSWLLANNGHFEKLLKENLKPEIGLEHGGIALGVARHRETARIIHDHGLGCAVHLSYGRIVLGSSDRKERQRGRELLLRALDLANIYEPDHLIGHPDYFLTVADGSISERGFEAPENQPEEAWLEHSAQGWGEVLDHCPARLYLENTYDQSPAALMALLDRLPERAALCFDMGHWYYAAQGHRRHNLTAWMDILDKRLAHLHLHDNDGHSDQHLGLGRGDIDYPAFVGELSKRNLKPSVTLEAHNVTELDRSLAWIRNEPASSRVFQF